MTKVSDSGPSCPRLLNICINMDYIYAADADEVLDDFNHERFLRLKNALLPEIEIVQMKYVKI